MYICIYAFRVCFFQTTRVLLTWPNQFLMWCHHKNKNNVYIYIHNWQIHDPHLLGVCAVNREHQQCSQSLVVNSGTTELASSLGIVEHGLVEQNTLTKITTTLNKSMKIRNMIGFVIFTCHTFSFYSFWVNLLFILWFSFIFHFSKSSFVPC